MRRLSFFGNFGGEASFNWLFERRGTILLSKFGRMLVDFFIYIQNFGEGCWSLILWSKLYLEGWSSSSRSSYFYGVALCKAIFWQVL